MNKRDSADDLNNQIAQVQAQLDALQKKADDPSGSGLSADEQAQYQELVDNLEDLQEQAQQAGAEQRYAALKVKAELPQRTAPLVRTSYKKTEKEVSHAEAMQLYLRSFSADADYSPDAAYKARTHGFSLGNSSVTIPMNYDKLNFKNRTVLTKGGSHSVDDYIQSSYSDKLTEYITYFSPVVGLVASETTADGNLRAYFKVDDTAMIATYLTASSGNETTPTIPDTNITSGSLSMGTFDITTGFQKASFQSLRDSAVSLEDKIAKANANSLARALEDEIINAAGNGTTGVNGLLANDHSVGSVSTANYGMDDLEDLYYSIPQQYRANAIWLVNETTAKLTRQKLKDTVGRSLFDKNAIDGVEWDVMLGKKFVTSQYMPDDVVLFFNPDFYQLRLVQGQLFQVFKERFAPHTAWMGIMSFGGAWLGPTGASGAIQSLTITS